MPLQLKEFLANSYTAYHACENVKQELEANGFIGLSENQDWSICEGGKYYVMRGGSSLIAFTVGSLDDFSYKIVATHTDSPALKIKENPVMKKGNCATLNVETYGGGIWYSFFDRPLKIAGRVVRKSGLSLKTETVEAPFFVQIPSVAIHQNREANDKFSVNAQIDLQPLCALIGEDFNNAQVLKKAVGENVISYDLFLVNADMPYLFGLNDEFLAAPRIDNLACSYAGLKALLSATETSGICVLALMDNEEIGSLSKQGADGDFLETTLRRVAYALRFDDNEFYKALAESFMLSADNAHAVHPNHPEKADPTNGPKLGGGIVIKAHANKAYMTDALSAAVVKTVFENAEVPCQDFYNRSDVRSGSTLGSLVTRHVGVAGADIGIAQLAMHSACESIAVADYQTMVKGLSAYYATTLKFSDDTIFVE